MSDPIIKGVKKLSARPATRSAISTVPAKNRKVSAKPARPAPITKRSGAEKAPARKADKAKAVSTKGAQVSPKAKKSAAKKPAPSRTASKAKVRTTTAKSPAKSVQAAKKSKALARPSPKPAAKATTKPAKKSAKAPAAVAPRSKNRTMKPTSSLVKASPAPTPRPQPTQDEAAALRAFERAHKEFTRGRFADARVLFRQLIEQHAGVAEVTARARIYLNVVETRLRSESALPRDAEALYDRGVIELNRGEYVAAQEMFERALKREPEAPHIHYGLAATRARLGAIDLALQSLEKALALQPSLRVRAQHDHDFVALRNEPDYERLLFPSRH